MRFTILTLFPEFFSGPLTCAQLGRARDAGLVAVDLVNPRDFSQIRHSHVDDRPYGGGPGMLLKVEPIYRALRSLRVYPPSSGLWQTTFSRRGEKGSDRSVRSTASPRRPPPSDDGGAARRGVRGRSKRTRIILLTPAGKRFTQREAQRLAKYDRLVLLSGRYEGFDARVRELVDEEFSLGDFVLAGGELPAMAVVETVARHVPGVVGHPDALADETFSHGSDYVEYPQYTRPAEFRPAGKRGPAWKVPKVLLSGDHKKIAAWRKSANGKP